MPACVFLVCCLASSVLRCGLVPGGVGSLSAVPLLPLQLWLFSVFDLSFWVLFLCFRGGFSRGGSSVFLGVFSAVDSFSSSAACGLSLSGFCRLYLPFLLGLVSRGCAAAVQCLLFSLAFGLGQPGFVLLHSVMMASSVLVLRWGHLGCLFLMPPLFSPIFREGA